MIFHCIKNHIDVIFPLQKSSEENEGEGAGTDNSNKSDQQQTSNNPYLQDLSQYLVDESNAEEEELLGAEPQEKEEGEAEGGEQNPIIKITRDQKLIKVSLEPLVLFSEGFFLL